jgi:Rad52/22 family double-strand break repair protein
MAFTDTQSRQLKAKLDSKYVKTRKANGTNLHYVEGWHAIAEANRIFGFDAWDRRTVGTHCVWTGMSGQHYLTAYTAKVRIRVRAGDVTIVREGSGTGEGRALTPGEAHEIALQSAETDATKRALATFGNPFGLALYDREQAGVRQRPDKVLTAQVASGPWLLRSADGTSAATLSDSDAFLEALRRAMTKAESIETLFAVWEQNVATVRALNYRLKENGKTKTDIGKDLVSHLKSCAVALVERRPKPDPKHLGGANAKVNGEHLPSRIKIDKSKLKIGETKRLRSKEHLRFVARQPCLICGRTPSQAHHLRYAQPKGLGLKVSDEFTVPLCAIHHTQNHATGDERQWWQERNLDPLIEAGKLWRQSQDIKPKSADGGGELDTLPRK